MRALFVSKEIHEPLNGTSAIEAEALLEERRKWWNLGALLLALAIVVAGVYQFRHRAVTPDALGVSDIASVWSASTPEFLSLQAINHTYKDLDDQVAPIVSDSDVRHKLLRNLEQVYRALAKAREEIDASAVERHGLAKGTLVGFDGARNSWVVVPSAK